MKRLLLLAGLSLAGLGAVPAVASAHTLTGECKVTGTATFDPNLMGQSQTGSFDFQSGSPGKDFTGQDVPDGTTCNGTIDGKQYNGPVTVHVAGTGQLSCAQSSGMNAEGAITFPDGVSVPFKMDFTGIATEVNLTIKSDDGSEAGSGSASFAKYAGPQTLADCNTGGVHQLGFEATANVDNLTGGPPPGGAGSGTVTSQPPDSSGTPASTPAAPAQCVVPKLKGKTVKAAKAALKRAHCSLGKVTRKANRSVKKGRVATQKPKPGTRKAAGAKVAIVVSKGRR